MAPSATIALRAPRRVGAGPDGVPIWFAFLWAETIIALCVIAVVIAGGRTVLHRDDARQG